MATKKISTAVEALDLLANHFEFRDWDYTRVDNIESIRYTPEHDSHNKISYRIKNAAWWMFGKTPEWYSALGEKNSLAKRFRMAIHCLKRDPNTPDGALDSGNIITFWEETGEYLALVQPTVGALLATFLKEDPKNPHAILITKELDRLHNRMIERWVDGDIDGD